MAITFSKDISTIKLLMAYNNNIVEFSSNSTQVPIKCEVTGFNINAVIYPSPSGNFYFNLMEYIKAEINTNNFTDTIVPALDGTNDDSFTYDSTDGHYLNDTVLFKIIFDDASFETASRDLKFLSGVEQLESWKKNEILIASANYMILSPVKDRTNNTTYLKYWDGYPFEFSFYTNYHHDNFKLINTTNAQDYTFAAKGRVTSLYLSDGRTNETIENFLPLVDGLNVLRIEHDTVLQDPIINLRKEDSDCGIYIKFLNKYGKWNYWLFSEQHYRNRATRYESELGNDFKNISETVSPTLQSGKTASDSIKCYYEKLNEEERTILDGIIESPKILLFTGERFSKAEPSDWIEVTLKGNSFQLKKPKTNFYNIELEFELPNRYGLKL
ncbi:hypothetical protein [Flavobacterium sedimenticola]|uniref:Phage tail protein n=1 Tax=Flavobacterium sedimenticola TaxID=3043286 RepID=A0ABT6XMM9_9FLAO|nr:hypothetical protein [Flavobacterium sedimenticola]MDI9256329.1 hypothetical protein [Flavobacterium sedimenticola]